MDEYAGMLDVSPKPIISLHHVQRVREALNADLNPLMEKPMETKLTHQQNLMICQALCAMAHVTTPEQLKELRRALVNECEAVNAETTAASLTRLQTSL